MSTSRTVCLASGCHHVNYKTRDISYHRFPDKDKEPARYEAWVKAVKRTPSSTSSICSAHFRKRDFMAMQPRRLLKKEAVPSLFPGHPSYVQEMEMSDKQTPVKFPEVRICLTDIYACDGHNYNMPATSAPTPFHAVPDFPQAPVQPDEYILFPRYTPGPLKDPRFRRRLHASLRRYPWAHYDRDKGRVFCYTCSLAVRKGVLNSFDKLRTARIQHEFIDDGFDHHERTCLALDAHDTNTSHLACSEFLVKIACDLPRPIDQDGNPVEVNKPEMNSSKTDSAADNCGNVERESVSLSAESKPSEKQNAGEQEQINSIRNEPSGSDANSGVNHDLQGETSSKNSDLGQEKQPLSSAESKSVSKLKMLKKPSQFNFVSDQFPMYSAEKYAVPSVYYLLYLIKTKNMLKRLEPATLTAKKCYQVLANDMVEAGFTNFNSFVACHEIYQRVYRTFTTARQRYCLRLAHRGTLDIRKVIKPRNPIYYKMVGWVTAQNSKVLWDIVFKHNLSNILIELDAMHAEDITEEDHKVIKGFYTGPAEDLLIGDRGTSDIIKSSGSRSEPASRSDTTHQKSVSSVDVQGKHPQGTSTGTAPVALGTNITTSPFQSMRVRSGYSDPMVEMIRYRMKFLDRQQKKDYIIGIQKIFTNILTTPTSSATNTTSSVASKSSNSGGMRTVSQQGTSPTTSTSAEMGS